MSKCSLRSWKKEGASSMNVVFKNQDGKINSIDTYIVADRNGFPKNWRKITRYRKQ
jgi:hypothetical protein